MYIQSKEMKNRIREATKKREITKFISTMTDIYLMQKRNREIINCFEENIINLPDKLEETKEDFERRFITLMHTMEITHRMLNPIEENLDEANRYNIFVDKKSYNLMEEDKNLKYLFDKLIEKNIIILKENV